MNRSADVLFNDVFAGKLAETEDEYIFSYDKAYLDSPDAIAVSLTLPLQSEAFRDRSLFPFFDGLIPEGWLLDIAHRSWKIDIRDRMGLLLACCKDCIGMVSIIPSDGGDPT
jgi:serine/threonine-protein kinase HipA